MADEKYIFAFEVVTNEELYNNFTSCIGCDCAYCEAECLTHKKPIPRQEAIERMAKALCGANEECTRCPCQGISCKIYLEDEGYISDAEVALNALLDTPTLEERVEEICKNNPGIPDYDEFYKSLKEADNGGKN